MLPNNIVEIDATHRVSYDQPQIEFEYLTLPLAGYKPMSLLKAVSDPCTMVVLSIEAPTALQRHNMVDRSHTIKRLIFSRLPKRLRLSLALRTVLNVIPSKIDRPKFEQSYLDMLNRSSR